ncbi:MAG: hypothetical protein KF744_09110 [Taibaiella sp.]|nr:hypothetical protein [Taibaiella sp.]
MKRYLIFTVLLSMAAVFFSPPVGAQPYVLADRAGQLWNTSNGYYGRVNATTLDACVLKDSVLNTTKYFSIASWGRNYDSARVLAKNSSSTPYYQPYSQGVPNSGTISYTASVWRYSTVATPSVLITPEQSPTGLANSWTQVPGTTTATVAPTSSSTASTCTFNFTLYQRYGRLKVVCGSSDSAVIQSYYNFKPSGY